MHFPICLHQWNPLSVHNMGPVCTFGLVHTLRLRSHLLSLVCTWDLVHTRSVLFTPKCLANSVCFYLHGRYIGPDWVDLFQTIHLNTGNATCTRNRKEVQTIATLFTLQKQEGRVHWNGGRLLKSTIYNLCVWICIGPGEGSCTQFAWLQKYREGWGCAYWSQCTRTWVSHHHESDTSVIYRTRSIPWQSRGSHLSGVRYMKQTIAEQGFCTCYQVTRQQ